MQSSLSRPYVVTVVPATPAEAQQSSVGDLLIGALSMAALLLAVALVLGVVFGGVRVAFRRYFPSDRDRMPPVNPFEPGSTHPPSSPPR